MYICYVSVIEVRKYILYKFPVYELLIPVEYRYKLLKMDYEKGRISYYLLDDSDKRYINDFLRNRHNKDNKRMGALSKVDYFTHGFGLNYISVILIFFTVVSILIVFSSLQFASMSAKQLIEALELFLV